MSYDLDNIFARILRGEQPAFSVWENAHCLAFLDIMPQTDGHTLVLPKAQATDLFDLDANAARELIVAVQHVARGVQAAFAPDGVRIAQFNGTAAGQTVFHMHVHIVPCYADHEPTAHARDMAPTETLERHAARLRKVLA